MIAPARHLTTNDPDSDLMLLLKDDDAQAFAELYRNHHKFLLRVITQLMGDRSIADDLAQQVLIRVYKARHHYLPSAKFSTWLFTITRNVVISAKRQLNRQHKLLVRNQQLELGKPGWIGCSRDLGPEETVILAETRQSVADAISLLGRRQQQAIRLVYIHGRTYRQAATQMGVTVASIKQLIVRGKGNIRLTLQTDEEFMPGHAISAGKRHSISQ